MPLSGHEPWVREALATDFEQGDVEVQGCRVRALVLGEMARPTITLVHGGAAHAYWWVLVAPLLATTHRVIAVDLSGHGGSEWRTRYRFDVWAEEVLELTDHLGGGGTPLLVGHSMGGRVVTAAASRAGAHLRGVVLLDTPLRPMDAEFRRPQLGDGNGPATYPDRATLERRFRLRPEQPDPPRPVLDLLVEQSLVRDTSGWRWRFDPRAHQERDDHWQPLDLTDVLMRSECPVSLLVGERSETVLADVRAGLSRGLSDSRPGDRPLHIAEIAGAHHHVPLDRPRELVEVIGELEQSWGA